MMDALLKLKILKIHQLKSKKRKTCQSINSKLRYLEW